MPLLVVNNESSISLQYLKREMFQLRNRRFVEYE